MHFIFTQHPHKLLCPVCSQDIILQSSKTYQLLCLTFMARDIGVQTLPAQLIDCHPFFKHFPSAARTASLSSTSDQKRRQEPLSSVPTACSTEKRLISKNFSVVYRPLNTHQTRPFSRPEVHASVINFGACVYACGLTALLFVQQHQGWIQGGGVAGVATPPYSLSCYI